MLVTAKSVPLTNIGLICVLFISLVLANTICGVGVGVGVGVAIGEGIT